MSAASAAREAKHSEGKLKQFVVASATTIYKGTLVGVNASGLLVSMSDTGSLQFVGVAFETVVNPSGGVLTCRVWREGEFEFVYAGGDAAQAKVGNLAYAQDNQTVDEDVALTTNDYPVGYIVEVISATKVRVDIGPVLSPANSVTTGLINNSAVTTAKINDAAVTAAKLTTTLATGFINIPLTSIRKVAANVIETLANIGGVLASNSDPVFERVNGATDKAERIKWAAASVVEVVANFAYPPDLDDTQPVYVKARAYMAGATDTPVIAVGYFEGIGDANAGGNTAALGSAIATQSVTIAAADIGAYPNFASISLIPGAHGTDALYLFALWVEYSRK